MSASNFMTMRDFPLYVRVVEDEGEATYILQRVEAAMEAINQRLSFYKLSIESGYYKGVQFYVELEQDPEDMDDEYCYYYFDMCQSRAVRRFHSEGNEVRRALAQLAVKYDFIEILVQSRSSNGETWYAPATTPSRAASLAAAR